MIWASSDKRSDPYSTLSESATSDAEEGGKRSKRGDKSSKKGRRRGESKKNTSWFGGLVGSTEPSNRRRSGKKSKKSKTKEQGWKAKSSTWGRIIMGALLVIYLLNFVNVLYTERLKPQSPTPATTDRSERAPVKAADVSTSSARNQNPSQASVHQSESKAGESASNQNHGGGDTAESSASNPGTQQPTASTGNNSGTQQAATSSNDNPGTQQPTSSSNDNPGTQQPTSSSNDNPGTQQGTSSSGNDPATEQAASSSNSDPGTRQSTVSSSGVENQGTLPEQSPKEPEKHPLNRNMLELQVPANTGLLADDNVKEYYRKLTKAYLSTFTGGIHRQMYFDILRRRTYSLTPPGANKGIQTILFQIIENKVYMMDPYEVPRNSKPFYRTRINQVIWLLSKLCREGRIKNTEFLMAIHDCVQTVNKPHMYRGAHYSESNPAFTIVSCNFSDNIPFPMWEGSKNRDGGFQGWDETMKNYAQDDIPWEKKQDRAVFRGGNRPSMYFLNKTDADLHCDKVGRTRLLYLSEQQPDTFDVSVGGTCGGKHSALRRMEAKDHHKFKYILYAEGNCMWADRSKQQVFGPSAIIKQETPCGQFFEPLLKPDVHYIPTDFFFTDTVEKIKWARQNDEIVHQIVKNANEFAHNFLSLKGVEFYVEVLLEQYTALLVEPDIKMENGAIDVTDKEV